MSPDKNAIAVAAVADLLHKPAGTAYTMARAGKFGRVMSPPGRGHGLTISLHTLRERFGALYDLSDEAVAAASARHKTFSPSNNAGSARVGHEQADAPPPISSR